MLILLVSSIALIFYSYVFFPLLLKILAGKKSLNTQQWSKADDIIGVSIIMAARNEAAVIGEKIRSVYQCGFPSDKIEMLIGSDNSDDGTDEIIGQLTAEYPGVKLRSYSQRMGKPAILNELIPCASYPIVILTDANVFFAEGLVYKLIRHFKDAQCGLVGANVLNTGLRADGISEQESLYINRETLIKYREGLLWGTMMGPFGACYAIRRDDFTPFPAGILVDDFYLCMKVLEAGKQAVVDLRAICYEDVPNETAIEFRRKVRISRGNFQNLRWFGHLLLSTRNGLTFSFFSHKVLRWFTPVFILIALVANYFLLEKSWLFILLFVIQFAAALSPACDFALRKSGINLHLMRLAAHFYSMNAALLVGMFKSFFPSQGSSWNPTKRNLG